MSANTPSPRSSEVTRDEHQSERDLLLRALGRQVDSLQRGAAFVAVGSPDRAAEYMADAAAIERHIAELRAVLPVDDLTADLDAIHASELDRVATANAHPSFADPSVGIEQKIRWVVNSALEAELERKDKAREAYYVAQTKGRTAALVRFVEALASRAVLPVEARGSDEPSEIDEAHHGALEVLCRVFDDGADVAIGEFVDWYKPEQWLGYERALGAFVAQRLLAKRALTANEREGVEALRAAMQASSGKQDADGIVRVTITMGAANAINRALATPPSHPLVVEDAVEVGKLLDRRRMPRLPTRRQMNYPHDTAAQDYLLREDLDTHVPSASDIGCPHCDADTVVDLTPTLGKCTTCGRLCPLEPEGDEAPCDTSKR